MLFSTPLTAADLAFSFHKGTPLETSVGALPPADRRQPWVAPRLTKHQSLSALTQQRYQNGFRTDTLDAAGDPIPCSQGFCP